MGDRIRWQSDNISFGKLFDLLTLMGSSATLSWCFEGLYWSRKVTVSQAKPRLGTPVHCPSSTCLLQLQGKTDFQAQSPLVSLWVWPHMIISYFYFFHPLCKFSVLLLTLFPGAGSPSSRFHLAQCCCCCCCCKLSAPKDASKGTSFLSTS